MAGTSDPGDVVVVIGAGGMGTAVVRRLGGGVRVLLADISERVLEREIAALGPGYNVIPHVVDVAEPDSVAGLAATACELGRVTTLVHTAGVSPAQAPPEVIMGVDLVGTAAVLDAFGRVIAPGGAGVVVASMAGSMASLDPDLESRLATTPTEHLLEIAEVREETDAASAYMLAKRANQLRVRSMAPVWGRRGARLNSISPGLIDTPMGAAELAGTTGDVARLLIDGSCARRVGTADDVAGVVAFLVSNAASYVTGADVLMDGGVMASLAPQPTD
jgi:NAD(P)-dependent dehydrogenase (short-subunit alcohol dehydrogenase family)